MAGGSTPRHHRSRVGAEWAAALLLVAGLAALAGFVWASGMENGRRLLLEAVGVGCIVGALLGGAGSYYRCIRARSGRGWKVALGPKCTAVKTEGTTSPARETRPGRASPGTGTRAARSSPGGGHRATPRGSPGSKQLPRRRVSFCSRIWVRPVTSASEQSNEWKAKLWWQPEDFTEFLRVRVLIGRAYRAVAKRRGVALDSDFPAEPVLAHESRLGLNLGRQGWREQRRRYYVQTVLKEQQHQWMQQEERLKREKQQGKTPPAGCLLPSSRDMDELAMVARGASKRDRDYAVEQAEKHHEKTVQDLEAQLPEKSKSRTSLDVAQDMRRVKSMYHDDFTPGSPGASSEGSFMCAYSSESTNITPMTTPGQTPEQHTPHRRSRRSLTLPIGYNPVADALASALGMAADGTPPTSPSLDGERSARRHGQLHLVRQLSQIAERQMSEMAESEVPGRPASPHGQSSPVHFQEPAAQPPPLKRRDNAADAAASPQMLNPPTLMKSMARQRSPPKGDTRGYGLPRLELERAGVSATGHLMGRRGKRKEISEEVAKFSGEDTDMTADSDTRVGDSSNDEGERGSAEVEESPPPSPAAATCTSQTLPRHVP